MKTLAVRFAERKLLVQFAQSDNQVKHYRQFIFADDFHFPFSFLSPCFHGSPLAFEIVFCW